MMWLSLEDAPSRQRKAAATASSLAVQALPPPGPEPTAPEPASSAAITAPSRVDWYAQSARAVREQFAPPAREIQSLDSDPQPFVLPQSWQRGHDGGDEVDLGDGVRIVYVNSRCYTQIPRDAPPPDAQQATVIHCIPEEPSDEAIASPKRKRDHGTRPVRRGGEMPSEPRAGPAMGGTPIR